jgi:hypothetical protein
MEMEIITCGIRLWFSLIPISTEAIHLRLDMHACTQARKANGLHVRDYRTTHRWHRIARTTNPQPHPTSRLTHAAIAQLSSAQLSLLPIPFQTSDTHPRIPIPVNPAI